MLCGVGELTAIAGEGIPVSGGLVGTVEVASCASSDTEGRSEMVGVFPDGVVSGGMGVLCDPDVDDIGGAEGEGRPEGGVGGWISTPVDVDGGPALVDVSVTLFESTELAITSTSVSVSVASASGCSCKRANFISRRMA